MLDVVTWKWRPSRPYRTQFRSEHVNVLKNRVRECLSMPHRFSCITDDPRGLDPDIRAIPIWDTYADIPNPSNPQNPSCFRRLRMYAAEARTLIGERIVSIDIDMVPTGELRPLFDRPEDFVIWGGQSMDGKPSGVPYCWYNGSMQLLTAGSRQQVWEQFDPATSPAAANRARCRGSDQGWIAYVLGYGEAKWTTDDGVYSFKNHILSAGGVLPQNARMVAFHGKHNPWDADVQAAHAWVRRHWR